MVLRRAVTWFTERSCGALDIGRKSRIDLVDLSLALEVNAARFPFGRIVVSI